MTIAWVVGSGGLLGSALCRALRREGTELFVPVRRFSWACESELVQQFETAVQSFATRASNAGRWEIYWAAGVGTMGTEEEELQAETRKLSTLLRLIETEARLLAVFGAFALSSSAGAIYAGTPDAVITDETALAPTTAYARAKLVQEDMVRALTKTSDRVGALLARFSTLYGPGQSFGKQQGLLTHIARCILQNTPVRIYVPFDTIRDYIFSDDAADVMISELRVVNESQRAQPKIIASERPVTIAEILATFKRVTRRPPRVITSSSKLSAFYPRRVRFLSRTVTSGRPMPKTSLLVGIAHLIGAEREVLMRGWRSEVK